MIMFKSKESIKRSSKGRNPDCRFGRIPTDWNCMGILSAVRFLLLYFRLCWGSWVLLDTLLDFTNLLCNIQFI
jgi:hypothetical protein